MSINFDLVRKINDNKYFNPAIKLLLFGKNHVNNDISDIKPIPKQKYSFEEISDILKIWSAQHNTLSTTFTLTDLSKEININEKDLSYYFSKYENTTFKKWKLNIKLNIATKLILEKEEEDISQLFQLAGFKEESNFYRQFKKNIGCTPKEWRDCKGNLNLL